MELQPPPSCAGLIESAIAPRGTNEATAFTLPSSPPRPPTQHCEGALGRTVPWGGQQGSDCPWVRGCLPGQGRWVQLVHGGCRASLQFRLGLRAGSSSMRSSGSPPAAAVPAQRPSQLQALGPGSWKEPPDAEPIQQHGGLLSMAGPPSMCYCRVSSQPWPHPHVSWGGLPAAQSRE